MAVCDRIFERIDELNDEFVGFWEKVCNIESPTVYKEGVDRVSKCFIDVAEARGWKVEVLRQEVSGDCVCITMNSDSNARPVSTCAHIDTVHPVGSFGSPAVRIEGDRIYGPGVTDCKGGAVAALYAMCALDDCGFDARPVMLLLQSDEEMNSIPSGKATINYICEKAKNSIAHLNCESSRIGEYSAVLSRKGICRHHVEIKGKAAHASKCGLGASAIEEAAHIILDFEKYKDTGSLTFNCGTIHGGSAENTVPDFCSFSVEFRFHNNDEYERGMEILKRATSTSRVEGTEITLISKGVRPAMENSERNYELLDKMNAIYAENGLPTLIARASLGGSDAAETTVAGIPCVDSIAVAGDLIHTVGEYAMIPTLAETAK
ncbi:MAG: M20/M25/M40 family metallo-hydrolase, partial [Clostridia bacterium]|nr:M20/M25/M40 family metallo-hydrolase [Clostridia bacterium]